MPFNRSIGFIGKVRGSLLCSLVIFCFSLGVLAEDADTQAEGTEAPQNPPPESSPLKPFSTDGCSMWIDGTPEQPDLWRHCCVAHDLAYWMGGSEVQRQEADEAIKICVAAAQGKGMANYMYTNVRWGGSPYWMAPCRWGFGWNYLDGYLPRGYKTPSPQEQRQIDALMPAALATLATDALAHTALSLDSVVSPSSSASSLASVLSSCASSFTSASEASSLTP